MIPDEAISAHVQWKVKLRVHVMERGESKLEPDEIEHDDRCLLGSWIYGEGKLLHEHDEVWNKLREQHRAFHHLAALIVRHANAGNQSAALNLLDGDFMQHSFAVIATINQIRRQYETSSRPAEAAQ